ncbi:unnamed protein product [Linum trigynum]|uniref:UBN2 domain-containing protein n=1 Tax=Linum trigynum TaxID=586398 RepID=A0AAV2DBN3_9ROSI
MSSSANTGAIFMAMDSLRQDPRDSKECTTGTGKTEWNSSLGPPIQIFRISFSMDRGRSREFVENGQTQTKKNYQMNSKATNLLYCALGPDEYHHVTGCKSAKEIWDKLQIAHEGTTHVKISRINSLKQEFESFFMKPEESVKEMNERFTTIVNSLMNLGIIYKISDLVRKVLWALPKKWTPKVTAIEESKDLTKLSLDELMGSLITHEEKLKKEEAEEPRKEMRSIAFKTTIQDEDFDSLDEMEDEELAMLSKHVAKLMRLRKEKRRGGLINRSREGEDQTKFNQSVSKLRKE